jgi:pimeloyl-ACP methyl ester carboxylesterase
MKIMLLILIALALCFLAVYLWPVPKYAFQELSSEVDDALASSLRDFRKSHPLKQLTVDHTDWNYVALGQTENTILFLHGTTGAYDIWWQQLEALKDRYRLIAVTYPPVHGLEKLSRGVLAILDHEGIERTHIVGSSLGGYLAQYIMARHPEKVERAVFGNSFPPNDILEEKNRTIGTALPFLPEWLVIRVLRKSFKEKIYPTSGYDELTLAYMLEQSYGRMQKAHVISRYRCIIDPFISADPASLGIPVAIIESDNDPLVEEALREQLKEVYPSATVYTIQNAGHFPYLNRPEEYTKILDEFFR